MRLADHVAERMEDHARIAGMIFRQPFAIGVSTTGTLCCSASARISSAERA